MITILSAFSVLIVGISKNDFLIACILVIDRNTILLIFNIFIAFLIETYLFHHVQRGSLRQNSRYFYVEYFFIFIQDLVLA